MNNKSYNELLQDYKDLKHKYKVLNKKYRNLQRIHDEAMTQWLEEDDSYDSEILG